MKEVIWLFAVTVHVRPYIHHGDVPHRLLYQLAPLDFFFPTTCGKCRIQVSLLGYSLKRKKKVS